MSNVTIIKNVQVKPGQPALTDGRRYDGKALSLIHQPKFLPSRDFTVRVKLPPGNLSADAVHVQSR